MERLKSTHNKIEKVRNMNNTEKNNICCTINATVNSRHRHIAQSVALGKGQPR